jgi:hypothetical protein
MQTIQLSAPAGATTAQRQFNRYPGSAPIRPDIWRGLSKAKKRLEARVLAANFFWTGGGITRAPAKKSRGLGRPKIFGKDAKSATYGRDVQKFFRGDDFAQSGPRFTSRAVSDSSASKRNAEVKAGAASDGFAGAVISIDGKLRPRASLHAVDRAPIDLVSDRAERASAKRDGGRRARHVVAIVEDAADDICDASKRATVRDDLNLMAVDHDHLSRLKLAA